MKHVKLFESYGHPARVNQELQRSIRENVVIPNVKKVYMVVIDLASDTLDNWAKTIEEMAKVAPNCVFQNFDPVGGRPDYWDVTLVGPKEECQAIADYMNSLRGGDEVMAEPFRLY
jgi:hypothetical protein